MLFTQIVYPFNFTWERIWVWKSVVGDNTKDQMSLVMGHKHWSLHNVSQACAYVLKVVVPSSDKPV